MEEQKQCFKCGRTKPFIGFYKHPGTADGYLNKCKECAKQDARKNYQSSREKRFAYERSPKRKAKKAEHSKRYRDEHPLRYKAHTMANNAIRDGRAIRGPCEVEGCERKAEAHHEDYSKPLEVRWLCRKHHREEHGQVAD